MKTATIPTTPTVKHARRILEIARKHGLSTGLGTRKPGKMCIEAVVSYVLGEEHGDGPTCVGDADRSAKIRVNDSDWSSNLVRGREMARWGVMQLGTAGTDRWPWALAFREECIRGVLPMVLRAAVWAYPNDDAEKILAAADRCEAEGSIEAAKAASASASAYASASASASAYAYASASASASASAYAYASASASAYASAYEVRDVLLAETCRAAERAYERTGSHGLELLREIEAAGVQP